MLCKICDRKSLTQNLQILEHRVGDGRYVKSEPSLTHIWQSYHSNEFQLWKIRFQTGFLSKATQFLTTFGFFLIRFKREVDFPNAKRHWCMYKLQSCKSARVTHHAFFGDDTHDHRFSECFRALESQVYGFIEPFRQIQWKVEREMATDRSTFGHICLELNQPTNLEHRTVEELSRYD